MKHISEILKARKTIFADEDCEMCHGTGFVLDSLEGMERTCLCVVERLKEKEAESLE